MKKKEEEEEAMCEDPALTDEERTKRKAQLADLKKKRAQTPLRLNGRTKVEQFSTCGVWERDENCLVWARGRVFLESLQRHVLESVELSTVS